MKKYTIGLYEKAMPRTMDWRAMLECAKDCGYDFVEISIDETDFRLARLEWTKEQRLELVGLMKEVGVPIRTMCLSGHRKYPFGASDPAVRARGMEIMEKAIGLADDLGIRIIQLAGYDVYYEEGTAESERLFRENLAKAVHMAEAKGILMGFETMETAFMNTVGKSKSCKSHCHCNFVRIYTADTKRNNGYHCYKQTLNQKRNQRLCIDNFSKLIKRLFLHYRIFRFFHTESYRRSRVG